MLKVKFQKKLKQKLKPNKGRERLRKLRERAKRSNVNPIEKRFLELGTEQHNYYNRSKYQCSKRGWVNSDQCFLCFIHRLEGQHEFATRVMCKEKFVTVDEAKEKRLQKELEELKEREEKKKKFKSAREKLQKLRAKKFQK